MSLLPEAIIQVEGRKGDTWVTAVKRPWQNTHAK